MGNNDYVRWMDIAGCTIISTFLVWNHKQKLSFALWFLAIRWTEELRKGQDNLWPNWPSEEYKRDPGDENIWHGEKSVLPFRRDVKTEAEYII